MKVSAALLLAAACAGCASEHAIDPGLEAALLERASAAPSSPLREKSRVRITTEHLRGDFESVLVASPGASPRARLQLFPEVGGKILDLAATRERITGVMPQAGRDVDVDVAQHGADAPRDLLFFMGVTLLEMFAPIPPSRVRGAVTDGQRTVLRVEALVPGVDLFAVVGADGVVVERRFAFRGAQWVAREGDRLEIEGKDFEMTVERGAREPLAQSAAPDALFAIPLPGRSRP